MWKPTRLTLIYVYTLFHKAWFTPEPYKALHFNSLVNVILGYTGIARNSLNIGFGVQEYFG